MRLYLLELKRILKTRTTWVLLAGLLAMSALFGYLPATFVYHTDLVPDGEKTEISRTEALRLRREAQSLYAGELTPEKLQSILTTYQSVTAEYGDYYDEDFPFSVYHDQILPIAPFLHILREAYADPKTGIAADLMALTAQDMDGFYAQTRQHVKDIMQMEQGDYPRIQAKASAMYASVTTPLTYVPGYNTDSLDYVTLFLLVFLLGTSVLCAPTFSAEYQTKADDILRITKHGRARLAITKLAAALTILLAAFVLCMALLTTVSDALFGRDCLRTSIQIPFSAVCPADMDLLGLRTWMIWAGLASLVASACCTLYLSTRCRTTAASVICALLICLLPIIIFFMSGSNIATWVRCLLPAGGVGLSNGYLYALTRGINFLRLGQTGFWTPQVMLLAAIVEIPLFLALSVRAYCRHAG